MIRSMTGYGKASGDYKSKTISVEIKSLNSKFFDLNLRLPHPYKDKEMDLRSLLLKEAERGKMDVMITMESDLSQQENLLNREIIKSLLTDLKAVKKEFSLPDDNLLQIVMQMPQVINTDADEADEDEWKYIASMISQAIEKFNLFRQREGQNLQQDISQRMNLILQLLEQITPFEEGRINAVRSKLINSLKSLGANIETDKNRFEQELIYYLEKLDITEEKVRLAEHCRYFLSMLNDENNNGKKLGFIMQEIGREINT
ncbi:MAG TPA: DUF1732 domain-containing protein, partial [Bacteroidia bacterium]|nr:DUF1732 domain-containing protein [Bacteroidia bacterium]